MGVITYEMEVPSSIPPAKMFKAFVLDADNLIPKVIPQAIKTVETLEGDGGPGTIKITSFGEGSQFKSVKHRVDELDIENLSYKYRIIDGDALMGVLESIAYEVKIEGSSDGLGSICRTRSTYYTKEEDIQITEEQIKSGKDKAMLMFREVESYLLANPHLYN